MLRKQLAVMKTNQTGSSPAIDPRREEIAKVAYYFFEERGRQHGYDVADWLRAVAHVCTDEKHAQDICPTGESEAPNETKAEKGEPLLAPTALYDDRGLGGRTPCPEPPTRSPGE
jgi:hypothetical protein